MDAALALTVLGALLLVGAGAAKLRAPGGAVAAMRAVGLPSGAVAVRVGAAGECALGIAVLTTSSWVPRLVLAATYLAFGAFAVVSVRADTGAGCGCFGEEGGRVGARHVVVDLALGVAAAASVASSVSVPGTVAHGPVTGFAVLGIGAVSAALAASALRRTRAA